MFFFNIVKQQDSYLREPRKIKLNEDLFIKIAADDMEAFHELFSITEKTIYAFALSILKNHDDALDVVQETYLKIRASAHLYKPLGKPMAWIFTITRNLSISNLRSRNRFADVQLDEIENDHSFSYIANNEDKLVLQAAFKILNDQEREIILLHAISDFKHYEIAKTLGIPLSTELSKYHRGLKKLRKYLLEQEVL
ncbi:MAG: RNA polymerase sigma factor [Peptococcaceae bacterium]|nr:RNA polymerase sigma factor [Peptococcaceae bacterium]